jgi:hypothetical protein
MLAGQKSDGGSGDDAGVLDVRSAFGEPCCDGGSDPVAGLARIHTEEHAQVLLRAAELVGEGEAHGVNRVRIERRFAGDRSNTICAKQLPHGRCVSFST